MLSISRHMAAMIIAFATGTCLASAQTGPKNFLVLGDSLSQGLGIAFTRCFKAAPDVLILQKGKLNSGLSRKIPTDWVSEAAELAKAKPDVAIVQIGANDLYPMMVEGKFSPIGSDNWKAEYGRRVANIASLLADSGAKVYWVGLPYPQRSELQEPYRMINGIISTAVPADKAKFIDIWDTFQIDGKFSSYGPDVNNTTTLIRENDGIHFTAAGYTREANMMMQDITTHLNVSGAVCK